MQPVSSGNQWTTVSGGVGTTVVIDKPGVLKSVVWGGSFVGTLNLHDSASAAGTTATSQVISIPIPAAQYPFNLELNAQLKKGLTYQATGTPVVTIFYDR